MLCVSWCADIEQAADEWIDEDETYCKLRKLKPYHRATTSGGAGMPKLGIFRETNTVTFANEAVSHGLLLRSLWTIPAAAAS